MNVPTISPQLLHDLVQTGRDVELIDVRGDEFLADRGMRTLVAPSGWRKARGYDDGGTRPSASRTRSETSWAKLAMPFVTNASASRFLYRPFAARASRIWRRLVPGLICSGNGHARSACAGSSGRDNGRNCWETRERIGPKEPNRVGAVIGKPDGAIRTRGYSHRLRV